MVETMAAPATGQPASGALVELCSGVIKQLADLFAPGATPASADEVASRFLDLLRSCEGRAQRAGIGLEEVHLAKYALVALIDEQILLSNLPLKDDWLGRPLAQRLFDDLAAGEEFYQKLDQLRDKPTPARIDVIEVFHLCLAFGFRGRYGDKRGQDTRRRLIDTVAREINQARGVRPDGPLSPKAEAPETLVVPGGRLLAGLGRGPLWAVPVAVLAVVVVLYLAYTGILALAFSGFADPPATTRSESEPALKPAPRPARPAAVDPAASAGGDRSEAAERSGRTDPPDQTVRSAP